MLAPLLTILPIFALVLAGWLSRRTGVLGPEATAELNRFVVRLALPALLLDITAHAEPAQLWQPGFVAAFGLGAGLAFAAGAALAWARAPSLADAALAGLNAGYANTGFLGFPLTLVALGEGAREPTLIAVLITVCAVFAVAIVLIEIGLQEAARPLRLAGRVAASLARNPLLVAPVAGAALAATGLGVPEPAEVALRLLGAAASPCALVALGLFLAAPRPRAAGEGGRLALLVALKLLVQPLATWAVARALGLPPAATHAAVILAALPTGTGPFMLAEAYGREAGLTAGVILVSTLGSVVTLSLYLGLIG